MVQKASKGQELHNACDTEVIGVGWDMILTEGEQVGLLTNSAILGGIIKNRSLAGETRI